MRLLGDRILCKPIEVKQETTGGLILPVSMDKQNQFEVVMIGPKVKHLKVGDIIRKFKNSVGMYENFLGNSCIFLSEKRDVELVV